MRYIFPKFLRLRTRGQFKRMAHYTRRLVGNWIIIDLKPNHLDFSRLGITVSKKYGEAHERNRFKRIVREAFRLCREQLVKGEDLNVKPRSHAKNAQTQDIIHEMLAMIGHKDE